MTRAVSTLLTILLGSLLPVRANSAGDDMRTRPENISRFEQIDVGRLRREFRSYFATSGPRIGVDLELLKDRERRARFFDIHWKFGSAIDLGMPLTGFEEFGVSSNGDGTYSVDIETYQQWEPLDWRLAAFRSPNLFEFYASGLIQRGFRPRDLGVIQSYVDAHDLRGAIVVANTPLVHTVAAKLKEIPADSKAERSLMIDYIYQNGYNSAMTRMDWALGLMNSLDEQRQRILLSYLREPGGGTMGVGPSLEDHTFALIARFLRSGAYKKYLQARARTEVTTETKPDDDTAPGACAQPACHVPTFHPDKCISPVMVDLRKDGIHLGENGQPAYFDIDADGSEDLMQWVARNGDEAFLALDRNANGLIDDGSELVANGIPVYLEAGLAVNGFVGLAQYDLPALGGNDDGLITSQDEIWSELILWLDVDANGDSVPAELHSPDDLGVSALETIPKARKRDRYDAAGNRFAFWAWAGSTTAPQTMKMVDVCFAGL